MWPRARLHIGWSDLAWGLACLATPRERDGLEREIEAWWSPRGDALVTFSVRSGFDLVLQALALPAGSEVLFSALNIKGMPKIARRHALVPVPVDLELGRMAPDVASIERAITPATRALVVAPLFGTRLDLAPVLAVARRHGLFVIEDCAQAFAGREFTGSDGVDVSMFSFGPLKFATALGGALLRVGDPELLGRMRAIQRAYPVQTRRAHASRLLKFAAFKAFLSRPVLGAANAFLRRRGRDYEEAVGDSVRGAAGLGSAAKIRHRCSAPLLALLRRRLRRFRPSDLAGGRAAGSQLLALLEDVATCPGAKNEVHSFWAFPILVDDPARVMAALRAAGFDGATLRRSATVAPPPDRPKLDPAVAREALAKLLVLPCYGALPDRELRRQASVIVEAVRGGSARRA